MATKKMTAKKAPAATPGKKATPVADKPEKVKLKTHQHILSSNTQNALSIQDWGVFAGKSDLQGLCDDLGTQTKKVQAGDMSSVEAMLYGQAMTLQTMFTSLALQAVSETGLKQYQTKLTFALKAQAQCRSTLEALAEIKNPRPVQFVKQANMTTGPQQINNAAVASRTETIESEPNKLLEADHGSTQMDIRATPAAARSNPAMETVEAVHRAEVA